MTNIAIIGHKTRGKEVIEILEMLGGNNPHKYVADNDCFYFYIGDETRNIYYDWFCNFDDKDVTIFTLEEFIKKFPYKVGDRVRVPEYESEVRISKMYWDGNEVQYEVVTDEVEWYSAKELNEFNEPSKEKKINQMSLANCDLDEVEIVLGDNFELKIREGKYYAIRKKILYPKTYGECCKLLGCKADNFFTNFSYNGCDVEISDYEDKIDDLLQTFRKLIYCRNAYWKLYGERMGLGEPWGPDWNNLSTSHEFIKINKGCFTYSSRVLVFPTAEMRDAFLENFGYLIELCKELL